MHKALWIKGMRKRIKYTVFCWMLFSLLGTGAAFGFFGQGKTAQAAVIRQKALTPGLHKVNGHIVYVQTDGTFFKNGKKVIDGYVHVFDSNGYRIRKYKYYKPGWVLQNGKYYWRLSTGKFSQKTGLFKPTKNYKYYFYLDNDHSRATGFREWKGKIYYFVSNGKRYTRSGWKVIDGDKYYFSKVYRVLTGVHKVDGKLYYFGENGALMCNVDSFTYKGKEYRTDSNGVMSLVPQVPLESEAQRRCHELTLAYISRHTSSGQSNYSKFYSCYSYLLAYQNFFIYPDWYYDLSDPDWRFNFANDLLERGDLGGDCYGFACVVASCAKELGYEPYIYVAAEDHCFVMIDGLYYDNSGAIFGGSSPSRSDYTITHIQKF